MIPLILIAKKDEEIKSFLKNYIVNNNFTRDRIFEIYPLKNEILISQIREIRKELMISSSLQRLFIIYNFDKATMEAQNAFLKSLEEGASKNQFLLTVENQHLLQQTIRSRSNLLNLRKPEYNPKNNDKDILFLKKLAGSTNFSFLSDPTLERVSREEAINFINTLILYYNLSLFFHPKYAAVLKRALSLKSLLESNNLNPQLCVDNLLIFIFKTFRMKE